MLLFERPQKTSASCLCISTATQLLGFSLSCCLRRWFVLPVYPFLIVSFVPSCVVTPLRTETKNKMSSLQPQSVTEPLLSGTVAANIHTGNVQWYMVTTIAMQKRDAIMGWRKYTPTLSVPIETCHCMMSNLSELASGNAVCPRFYFVSGLLYWSRPRCFFHSTRPLAMPHVDT